MAFRVFSLCFCSHSPMVTSRERRKVDVALTDVLRTVDPPLTPQTLCCRTCHSAAGRPGCFRCNWNSRDLSWSWYYHVTVANVAGQTRSWRKKPCVYRDLHTVHVIYKYKCTLMFTYTILGYSNRRLECFFPQQSFLSFGQTWHEAFSTEENFHGRH